MRIRVTVELDADTIGDAQSFARHIAYCSNRDKDVGKLHSREKTIRLEVESAWTAVPLQSTGASTATESPVPTATVAEAAANESVGDNNPGGK